MKISELKQLLRKSSCYFFREGGNHEIWYSPLNGQQFSVPRHNSKEIPTGSFHKILKDAGIKKTR